jgi:multiple antibiotic resistance protein
MDFGFLLKKTLTLLALVDPFLVAPIFLAATAKLNREAKIRFARMLAITVGIGLMVGGLLGMHVLAFMGVSLGAMQFAGGFIALVVALAMVVAKEEAVKMTPSESACSATTQPSLVPLGIPLLVGPAALSYVMATSHMEQAWDLVHIVVAPLVVALVSWGVLEVAARTQKLFSAQAMSVVERVVGFLLAAVAVEMMASGIRALFPSLAV